MSRVTIGFGILLILLGIGAYLISGGESVTSLIPAIAGLPIIGVGYLQSVSGWEQKGLYIAIALAAILALGTVRGVTSLLGGTVTTGSVVSTLLLVLSFGYMIVAVRSLRT
jgi:hypothetical protein